MQILILGFDAFDPARFERLSGEGRLPNLARYADSGGYAPLEVATPPQTEVSWTSMATGLDPGGHGIFDFVHRDPETYTPYVSLLPVQRKLFGTQFVPPFKTRTIFEEVAQDGFPATALWWPATFPAQPDALARTIPGLGTPDIRGRVGVGTLFSTDGELSKPKTPVSVLTRIGRDRFSGSFSGPVIRKRKGVQESAIEFELDLRDEDSAYLRIGTQRIDLTVAQWSPILELSFRVGRFMSVRALTRVILTQVQPDIMLYTLPLQVHPLHTPWHYATPRPFVKQTWNECGPFLTLGWPQDTTALEEECITDQQFLSLCQSIMDTRWAVLKFHLQTLREGMLASIFDSLDRVQHMFWRDRPDIVDEWYVKLDALVGDAVRYLAKPEQGETKLFVVSDHGFSDFDYKVHLNRWLIDNGHLAIKEECGSTGLSDVDWPQSHAYAVGLNSLYLNLEGREGQGTVSPDRRGLVLDQIRKGLSHWHGPDGHRVVRRTWLAEDLFSGPFTPYAPDLVIGYSPGYRASADTGLGKWGIASLERNQDHWGADHCIDPQAVPGLIVTNQSLDNLHHPSYRDIPALTIGKSIDQGNIAPPTHFGKEDQEIIEERLQGLGYL